MPLSYDRRIRYGLFEALTASGVAHGLVRRHLSDPTHVDLHLRAYRGKAANRATLYCGTTRVLNLIETNRHFRLEAAAKWRAHDHHGLPWMQSLTTSVLARVWPNVERYLDMVIPVVATHGYFLREGSVQNVVGRLSGSGFAVFDREAVPCFTDTPEKNRIMAEEAGGLLAAVARRPGDPTWWNPPANLGEECDAVALDTNGRFIAIEVKHSRDTTGITWAPLQVAYYARLFRRWATEDLTCRDSVLGMLSQRVRLGLTIQQDWHVKQPMTVQPMVIVGGGSPTPAAQMRCELVRDRLADSDLVGDLSVSLLVGGRLQPFLT